MIYNTEQRSAIPRWRSFKLSITTGETILKSNKKSIQATLPLDILSEQKDSWGKNKNIAFAGDLLSSASALGIENQFGEVAEFVIQNMQQSSNQLIKLANRILKIDTSEEITKAINTKTEKHFFEIDQQNEIQKFRSYLKAEPKNPIAWIELGRLYCLIGKTNKAKRCIDNALFLDKNNRFIVRSASRFYLHFQEDKEAALNVIKKSEFVKSDPWLISAEIAYSSILNRHSRLTKTGIEYIDRFQNDPLAITELASTIGTLEFYNGKNKRAKKYFEKALLQPNDNSIAQVNWVSAKINNFEVVDTKPFNLPLAYEADAQIAYSKGQYQKSFDNAMKWHDDEPYSSRPIRVASYVSSVFLDDKIKAINLLKKGIVFNPKDSMLKNNLAYYLLKNDNLIEAESIVKESLVSDLQNVPEVSQVSMTATLGLYYYRIGETDKGRELYLKSIQFAKKLKHDYLLQLATVNYLDEEIRICDNNEELAQLIKKLENVCDINSEPDVTVMQKKTVQIGHDKMKKGIL